MTMTLEEAIIHAKEHSCLNDNCSLEHKQLAEWLEELKEYRNNDPKYYYRNIRVIYDYEEVDSYDIGDTLELYVGNKEIYINKNIIEFDSKTFEIGDSDIVEIGDNIIIVNKFDEELKYSMKTYLGDRLVDYGGMSNHNIRIVNNKLICVDLIKKICKDL